MSRTQLGLRRLQMGHPGEAEGECRRAVAIEQELVNDNPSIAIFYRDAPGQML